MVFMRSPQCGARIGFPSVSSCISRTLTFPTTPGLMKTKSMKTVSQVSHSPQKKRKRFLRPKGGRRILIAPKKENIGVSQTTRSSTTRNSDIMEKLVSLSKRRGFIFQSSEIYGGLNGCWD